MPSYGGTTRATVVNIGTFTNYWGRTICPSSATEVPHGRSRWFSLSNVMVYILQDRNLQYGMTSLPHAGNHPANHTPPRGALD